MKSNLEASLAAAVVFTMLLSTAAIAQWLNYPTPGTPRLADGKPDLSAPAPRTADGKPDLSGVWRGAGPLYRFNIAQDLKTEDVQPWAEALFLKRVRDNRKESPLAQCLPVSVPFHNFFNLTRIVQTPALTMILYESPNSPHRTVFTDGRDLPNDPNPTFLGYSIGRWEGDTLVVTTAGFNDLGWLDSAGHPQTESLRITERLRRRDFGHMDFEMTIDDPKVFTRPFTFKAERLLAPDTDLLEDVCENERDGARLSGDNGVRVSPELLATYAGAYDLGAGREAIIAVTGDMLFVQGLGEPKLPLVAQSETQFMSTATPTGFEFIKDGQGNVTHLMVRGATGDQRLRAATKGMRKGFTRRPQADEPGVRVKNYITPSGLQRLKDEHRFLLTRERPAVTKVVAWAASNGDRSENADYQYGKRRLRQIDGRIRFLTKRIDAAEVVDPERPRSGQAAARAFFGATVRYANAAGTERVVSIVGTDEVDLKRDHISWVSPLARALMKAEAGDRVVLQAPGGTEYLTVLDVCYAAIPVEPFRVPPGAEASAKELPADADQPHEG